MNIFVLDSDPYRAAHDHCDKHVVKIILETAQLLSTAHHVLNGPSVPDGIYKPTHVNHPCSVWVRSCSGNYLWALGLLASLCSVYTDRYQKVHKTTFVIESLLDPPKNIRQGDLEPFALAMPEQYKQASAVESYRAYYRGEKRNIAVWSRSPQPDWWD